MAVKKRKRRLKALDQLDREQRAAVTRAPGKTLVIAGAGSGKTRVVTHRAAFLIEAHDVEPESILAITLTNKAKAEMVARLRFLCGDAAERIQAGTFHAVCARILRTHPKLIGRTGQFSIYDEADARRVIAKSLTSAEQAKIKPATVLREISANKNHDVPVEEYASFAVDPISRIIARVWREYEEEMRLADALDFDDLLLRTVELLRAHPDLRAAYQELWPHVQVDEYQDTNPTQARLLRQLVSEDFMAVGDDKQVIFGFRLADVRLILEFDQEYQGATVITLERNYRNSKQILNAANSLIAHNTVQRPMTLEAAKKEQVGPPVAVQASDSDVEEAQWIALRIQRFVEQGDAEEKDIAVLARNTSVVERVEHALAAAGINYQLVGSRGYFRRAEIRTALAHLRLIVNPRNEEAFIRALRIRPQVGDATLAKIIAYSTKHHLSLLEASLAVDVIEGIRSSQARENVRQFAYDMLAFIRQARSVSVSDLTYDVIRMRFGVAESLVDLDDAEQRFARLEALREAACTYERQTDIPSLAGWLQDAMLAGRDDLEAEGENGRVSLGTIHAFKGLERPIVIGAGFEGRTLPSYRAQTEDAMEEERRVAYVLITRATRVLILSYAMTRDGRVSGPSPFISQALSQGACSVPSGAPKGRASEIRH
jgi:DNA helicase-2/ATP-dependent DNA helicase PcrA